MARIAPDDLNGERRVRGPIVLVLACGLLAGALVFASLASCDERQYGVGPIEYEVKSEYSHIRIRRQNDVRSLLFVDDDGAEIVESAVDLKAPHDLLVPYTRYMFASYLFRPKQERVLIVGLGGGAMIHFLKHYAPRLRVDVVEIDPVIVKIAEKYFRVRSSENVRIMTVDGFEYLRETNTRYDVIYMDAFLRPCQETDPTGTPLRLRTARFLKSLRNKLKPSGLVVFNLHSLSTTASDTRAIRDAFPNTFVFQVPLRGNRVAVATTGAARMSADDLARRARALDRDFPVSFSFEEIAKQVAR